MIAFANRTLAYFKPEDRPHIYYSVQLQNATTFYQWQNAACEYDEYHNAGRWRGEFETLFYDHTLIFNRLQNLKTARLAHDIPSIKLLIRSGLLRNLGGIGDARRTKHNIEEYLYEVCSAIQFICDIDPIHDPLQQRLELFGEIQQSFGHTALLLHGGATFGLYHLGVIKALLNADLLPRIISGSSVGALIAALVCTHTKEELPTLFLRNGIDLAAFTTKNNKGSISRKITRLLTKGYLLDVKVLEDCVKSNLSDITFEEAYSKTGMVLNITVSSSRKNENPWVLNHITTPNVLIRSAACASASMVGLYSAVDLLAKDSQNQIFVWSPSAIKWGSNYAEMETPEQRLAELFNVNNFILSQAQPYIAPFLAQGPQNYAEKTTIFAKALIFVSSEIRFRMTQLSRIGLIPSSLGSLFDLKVQGHITIAPKLSSLVLKLDLGFLYYFWEPYL